MHLVGIIDYLINYDASPAQNDIIWCPGLNVCEQLGQILMILPLRLALEWALHRNDLLFYFEYISEPVFYYFWVKTLNQCFCLYQ